jgi:hypothetical protein
MYEHRTHRLLPRRLFLRRAAWHLVCASALALGAVAFGTIGYRSLGHLTWIDAFLNASMILGGMGPVDRMDSSAAKLFAALYALFSGLMFIAIMSVVLTPWLHRLLHWVHLDEANK